MNKRFVLITILVLQCFATFAKKKLSDNLISKGNITAISAVDHDKILFAKGNKVFQWSKSSHAIVDSIDFQSLGKIMSIDFSSENNTIAAGFLSGELFIVRFSGKPEKLPIRFDTVISVKFSNDGNYLAIATADCNLSMWDITNRQLLWSKKGHDDHILSISFSPNDSIVFSGSADKRVGIWNTQKGTVSGYLTESVSWIRRLAVSKTKSTLYAATDEGTIYTWKITGANTIFTGKIKESSSWALALAVSENGDFASGFKNGYFVFRTRYGKYYTNFSQPVVDVAMLAENDYVSFFVSVLNQGLYFVDLSDNVFKLSSN
jgi:WD40 repeat protein